MPPLYRATGGRRHIARRPALFRDGVRRRHADRRLRPGAQPGYRAALRTVSQNLRGGLLRASQPDHPPRLETGEYSGPGRRYTENCSISASGGCSTMTPARIRLPWARAHARAHSRIRESRTGSRRCRDDRDGRLFTGGDDCKQILSASAHRSRPTSRPSSIKRHARKAINASPRWRISARICDATLTGLPITARGEQTMLYQARQVRAPSPLRRGCLRARQPAGDCGHRRHRVGIAPGRRSSERSRTPAQPGRRDGRAGADGCQQLHRRFAGGDGSAAPPGARHARIPRSIAQGFGRQSTRAHGAGHRVCPGRGSAGQFGHSQTWEIYRAHWQPIKKA